MRRLILGNADGRIEKDLDLREAATRARAPGGCLWLDLSGEPAEGIEEVGRAFGLHPLAIEDCLHRNQRPKLEEFDGHVFLVIHLLRQGHGGNVKSDELHVFLARQWLLTVHDGGMEVVDRTFGRCLAEGSAMAHGPSFLLHLLSDAVVDGYFPVLDAVGDEIEALEDAVIRAPTRGRLNRIFALKRTLVQLRKVLSPQREVYNALSRRDYPYVDPRSALYFRDVYDHLVRAYEMLDSYRDLLANTLEAHLTTTSNRLGEVMRRLTIIATIFMPLSFVTGFFGMNFARIPWGATWLLWTALAAIAIVPIAMVAWFARSGWLRSWVRLEDGRRHGRHPPPSRPS